MKRSIILLTFYLFAISVFSQNIDDSGNIITSEKLVSNKETHLRLKSSNLTNLTIIKAIPSPTTSTNDIAFDGVNLWQASNDGLIYKISSIDGTLLKTIPVNTNYASGLTFDGTFLWVSDRTNQLLLKIDTLDGTIHQQFSLNNDGADGLAWANSNLWHNNDKQPGITYIGDTTFYISSISGEILDYFLPIGPQPKGLTFDGTYLWSTDNYNDKIYKIDLNSYTSIDTIDAPGGTFPNGLAFDGQYLWVSNNDADSLYQIDIGFTPAGINDFSKKPGQIIVYPNPSSGSFTFNIDLNVNGTKYFLNIYNQNGQVVRHKTFDGNSSIVMKLDDLSSSIYFYTISDNYEILAKGKLIKE